jgi:hypothetical protein
MHTRKYNGKSVKKFPGFSDGEYGGKRFGKNQANRRVRRYKLWLPNGSTYKKLYERWCISDYNSRWYSEQDLLNYAETNWKEGVPTHKKPYYQQDNKYAMRMFWHFRTK